MENEVSQINELSLFRGSPIKFQNVGLVHPFNVGDIETLGEELYEKYLQFLTIDEERLKNILKIEDKEFTTYEFIVVNCMNDKEFCGLIIDALSYIFKEPVSFSEHGFFYVGELEEQRYLFHENYNDFKKILRLQNCLDKKEEIVEENPANAKAAELLRRRNEVREKLKKAKSGEGEPLAWEDLISILCANGNGITVDNVWNLSVYAFNKQFVRMKMLEEFDISVRSLLAGAKQEDVELVHWMSKSE